MSKIFISGVMVLCLSACGNTTSDRALSGGAIGAGTGAAIGAVTGGSLATGALIGGAGGALLGGATNSKDVNLGTPVWRK